MFGMAMKFLQLGLEPIIGSSPSKQNENSTQNHSNDHQKPKVKSTQVLRVQNQNQPISQNTKENTLNDFDINLQELKLSQQKVLEDFKKSIQRSIAFSNRQQPGTKYEDNLEQPYDLVEGIVLSKIQELSEEYMEYSVRKEISTFYPNQKNKVGLLNLDSNNENKQKSSSCELIKSIVKSVLLPESITVTEMSQKYSFQNVHLKQSSVKRSQNSKIQQNNETNNKTGSKNSVRSSQPQEPVNEFIKELFQSLGLIEKNQKTEQSLREMTQTARKKFNALRGNDYAQKLNEMLQSVEGLNKSRFTFGFDNFKAEQNIDPELRPTPSAPITLSYKKSTYSAPALDAIAVNYEHKNDIVSKKQSIIKRPFQRKVKLISPQTLSELESKRTLIDKQITEALDFLTVARRVKKFSFYSKDINEVILNFSFDFHFMSYKRVQKGFFSEANLMGMARKFCDCTRMTEKSETSTESEHQFSMIPLKWNLVNIAKGLKTKNFIKFEDQLQNGKKRNKQALHEDRCFSLLFKNRTYDFECESTAIRDEYFRAIKIMIKSSCEL